MTSPPGPPVLTPAGARDTLRARYDVVVVGGGHNGLTSAAYLARAGRSVLLVEQADHLGGATVSAEPFPGVPARLSRYSYLVSLMPRAIRDELGLDIRLRRRRISSYTPLPGDPGRGLLVDTQDPSATRASLDLIGEGGDADAWLDLQARTAAIAGPLFATVTGQLPSGAQARALLGRRWWRDLVERPLGEMLERTLQGDVLRGVLLTDALIGTFASARSESLIQNRCWLYHVIGGGTGDWDVPVGGMGAVSSALARSAAAAGATLVTETRVSSLRPTAREVEVGLTLRSGEERTVAASHVVAGCSPWALAALTGERSDGRGEEEGSGEEALRPEGAQLKVNMVLSRLPRLRDSRVRAEDAFAGTFHVNETYSQLETAYAQAASGRIPSLPPAEIYCHTLTDRSILGAELAASGAHTLTLFGLHMPARLFRAAPEAARAEALAATLRSLDSVLAEPLEDCLLRDAEGRPCLEARSPVDLEQDVALPGGHIFHRDLAWPWAEDDPADLRDPAGRWGVRGPHPRVLLAGAGAVRGGGVSGIPGRSAAMALLEQSAN